MPFGRFHVLVAVMFLITFTLLSTNVWIVTHRPTVTMKIWKTGLHHWKEDQSYLFQKFNVDFGRTRLKNVDVGISMSNRLHRINSDMLMKFYPKSKLNDTPLSTRSNAFNIENSQSCQSVLNVTIVFLISSAPEHFERRTYIRQTWGNDSIYEQSKVLTMFVLGRPIEHRVQKQVEEENILHGDIVQGRFLDSYLNLTEKTVLAIRWVSENCIYPKLVAKVDDDVFVNVFKLLVDLDSMYSSKTHKMWCFVRPKGTSPIQRDFGKWAIGYDYFKTLSYFPFVHCNGFFVAMTPSLSRILYDVSKRTPVLRLDDVYLTGILPMMTGSVQVQHLNSLSLYEYKALVCFRILREKCYITAVMLSDSKTMCNFLRYVT